MRPLIGLTAGNLAHKDGRSRWAIPRSYVDGLQAAGADVVLLPPTGPHDISPRLLDALNGLLLPGGADVNPAHYDEMPREGLGAVDDELDSLEINLVHEAVERRLPILGICRGQQVLNVALGGTLYQDLRRDGLTGFPHKTPAEMGRDYLAHFVVINPDTHLHAALGVDRVEVNSHHHQAVRDLAPGLRASAFSEEDRVIEGIESPDGRIVAIQCHPEDLTVLGWARDLFQSFVLRSMPD